MNEILKEIWLFIRVTFNPTYWIKLGDGTNWEWDKIVRKALSTGDIKYVNRHKAQIGGIPIWIENYPYAYGGHYNNKSGVYINPSRRTCLLIKQAVDKVLVKEKSRIDELIEMYGDK